MCQAVCQSSDTTPGVNYWNNVQQVYCKLTRVVALAVGLSGQWSRFWKHACSFTFDGLCLRLPLDSIAISAREAIWPNFYNPEMSNSSKGHHPAVAFTLGFLPRGLLIGCLAVLADHNLVLAPSANTLMMCNNLQIQTVDECCSTWCCPPPLKSKPIHAKVG